MKTARFCLAMGAAIVGAFAVLDAARLFAASHSFADSSYLADTAWEAVMEGVSIHHLDGYEDSYEAFLASVELSKQQLRRRGSEFWEAQPSDPRRYTWLLMALHLAPDYPVDLDDWAKREAGLAGNTAELDAEAQQAWAQRYSQMRVEFMAAAEVSDEQRRYLRLGEILSAADSLRQRSDRGEAVEPQPVLRDILDYAQDYPAPFSEMDARSHVWALEKMLSTVAQHGDAWSLPLEQRAAFERDFGRQVGSVDGLTVLHSDVWKAFVKGEGIPGFPPQDGSLVRLVHLPLDGAIFAGRRTATQVDQPGSVEAAYFVLLHNREVTERRLVELGRRLWSDAQSLDDRFWWLRLSVNQQPYFMANIFQGVTAFRNEKRREIAVDTDARLAWKSDYARFRREIWSDPRIADEQRSSLRETEISKQLIRAKTGELTHEGVLSALDGIHELWTVYGVTGRSAASPARSVDSWGLSESELDAFYRPMLDYESEALRSIAEAWFRKPELRSTPLEFTAPTLEGAPFDIADLRGKIVLMEYWSTFCTSCIAAKPRIHDIYLDYQSRGFEVVSVNFDAERNRRRIERIRDEMGLTWTTLDAEAQWAEVNARFGWGNVLPAYMLLDREGRLVADTGEVDYGRGLRAQLDEMLAAEAESAN